MPKSFRNIVGKKFDLQIPPTAFVAMDYHLDWLYASFFYLRWKILRICIRKILALITANQEDIDLLIAFKAKVKTRSNID